jgi:hypothetical protein
MTSASAAWDSSKYGSGAGDVFALKAFIAQLLANTAGAAGAIEIMPRG